MDIKKLLYIFTIVIFFTASAALAASSNSFKKVDLVSLRTVIKKDQSTAKKILLKFIDKNINNQEKIKRLITNLRAIDLSLGNYIYTANYLYLTTRNNFLAGHMVDENLLLQDLIRKSNLIFSSRLAMHPEDYIYQDILEDSVFLQFLENKKLKFFVENRKVNKENILTSVALLKELKIEEIDRDSVEEIIILINQIITSKKSQRAVVESSLLKLLPRFADNAMLKSTAANLHSTFLLDALESGEQKKSLDLYIGMTHLFPDTAIKFKKFFANKDTIKKKLTQKDKNDTSFLSSTIKDKKSGSFPFGMILLIFSFLFGIGYYLFRRNHLKEDRIVIKNLEEPKFDELIDLAGSIS